MFKHDDEIAKNFKMISNHGQEVKYCHKVTGCYSRLDSIQFKL
jgi:UDP-2-acetamido-2-deoxy-ribo-hexuluronate aminotransferase